MLSYCEPMNGGGGGGRGIVSEVVQWGSMYMGGHDNSISPCNMISNCGHLNI